MFEFMSGPFAPIPKRPVAAQKQPVKASNLSGRELVAQVLKTRRDWAAADTLLRDTFEQWRNGSSRVQLADLVPLRDVERLLWHELKDLMDTCYELHGFRP